MIYRWGFRPKFGSIFFSPSAHERLVLGPAAREGLLSGFKQMEERMTEDKHFREMVKLNESITKNIAATNDLASEVASFAKVVAELNKTLASQDQKPGE